MLSFIMILLIILMRLMTLFMFKRLNILRRYESTKFTYVHFGTADNPRIEKIPSKEPLVVSAFNSRKFPTRRSSLWTLPTPPHTSREQAETHNGVANLPKNNNFKQMQ